MKTRRIIDSHAHLGDIFHVNLNCSFKNNIKKGDYPDHFETLEKSGFNTPLFTGHPDDLAHVIDGGQFRCWEFGIEQLSAELDATGMAGIVLLPVLPNTSFEEYLAASKLDPRIIPFTAADMLLPLDDMLAKLKRDVGRGAKGLKLHPVLQNVPAYDERMVVAANLFGEFDLPVVMHVGVGQYYHDDTNWPQNPAYGAMEDFAKFAHMVNPGTKLVAAHCAAFAEDLMACCGDLENLYADTSFCNAELAAKAVDVMGPDRVLYGTDCPFTHERYNVQVIDDAFVDEPDTKDKVFYRNIARLCHL